MIFVRLKRWLLAIPDRRVPDDVIGPKENPYMLIWYIIPNNKFFNIRINRIVRSDYAGALHDHPWSCMSVILRGSYIEHVPMFPYWSPKLTFCFIAKENDIIFRLRPSIPHRLEITGEPCTTLFVTGPKVQRWGFWCKRGWVDADLLIDPQTPGEIRAGCGEAPPDG